jgi:putative acyl-CoA dehydrogenase
MCLDVLRALSRSPVALGVVMDELSESAAAEPRLKAFMARLSSRSAVGDESQARSFARDLVVALQAALLVRHAPAAVADAFCASRLNGGSGAFGMLPPGADCHAIVARAAPRL